MNEPVAPHRSPLEYVNLATVSKLLPSCPHPSCIWRWCRRGVKSRSGERIKLEHVRIGGKIFCTAAWLDEFGRRLAEADAQHFDARDDEADAIPPRGSAYGPPRQARRLADASTKAGNLPDDELADIERELEEEGL